MSKPKEPTQIEYFKESSFSLKSKTKTQLSRSHSRNTAVKAGRKTTIDKKAQSRSETPERVKITLIRKPKVRRNKKQRSTTKNNGANKEYDSPAMKKSRSNIHSPTTKSLGVYSVSKDRHCHHKHNVERDAKMEYKIINLKID
jgi:hypothetical protein